MVIQNVESDSGQNDSNMLDEEDEPPSAEMASMTEPSAESSFADYRSNMVQRDRLRQASKDHALSITMTKEAPSSIVQEEGQSMRKVSEIGHSLLKKSNLADKSRTSKLAQARWDPKRNIIHASTKIESDFTAV